MNRIIFSWLAFMACVSAFPQSGFDRVLKTIEENSLRLKALKEKSDAEKLASKSGLALDDPEVEFHYLWGAPSSIGNRIDISASQSFDFPTAYVQRKRLVRQECANAELAYRAERMELLLEAKRLCVNLAYVNSKLSMNAEYLSCAEKVYGAVERKYDEGEANALELGKARLAVSGLRTDKTLLLAERDENMALLRAMNGGNEIEGLDELYLTDNMAGFNMRLPALSGDDFDTWFSDMAERNPALLYVKGKVARNEVNVKLSRSMNLPKFTVGYVSEKTSDEYFRGLSVGVALPVWGNRNRAKLAKAELKLAQAEADDACKEFYVRLRSLCAKANALWQQMLEYGDLSAYNKSQLDLLGKAYEQGEVDLIDYVTQVTFYRETEEKGLEVLRGYGLAIAELQAILDRN